MKLSELKLIKQWHSYVGPTDERLEKESCKIYRTGFLLLTSGMLLYFIYGLTADQVAWVHNISNDPFKLPDHYFPSFNLAFYCLCYLRIHPNTKRFY